eukprot:4781365-Prymnesium_polylepis.1
MRGFCPHDSHNVQKHKRHRSIGRRPASQFVVEDAPANLVVLHELFRRPHSHSLLKYFVDMLLQHAMYLAVQLNEIVQASTLFRTFNRAHSCAWHSRGSNCSRWHSWRLPIASEQPASERHPVQVAAKSAPAEVGIRMRLVDREAPFLDNPPGLE